MIYLLVVLYCIGARMGVANGLEAEPKWECITDFAIAAYLTALATANIVMAMIRDAAKQAQESGE